MSDAWDAADPGPRATAAKPVDAWDAATPVRTPEEAAFAKGMPTVSDLGKFVKNIPAGALSEAANIGSNLMASPQELHSMATGKGVPPGQTQQRKESLGQFFNENADPNNQGFKLGGLATDVAGTAGVGPVFGGGAKLAGASPEVVAALRSGGMSLGGETTGSVAGNAALRTAAGGAVGAGSTALVNPQNVQAGGAIGAVTPGAAWLAGLSGRMFSNVAGGITKNALGATTGTGADSVEAAYKAGFSGDRSFIDNMRGNANFSDIVDQAKGALDVMRTQRGQAYRQGMAAVSGDKTVLDMAPIQQSVKDARDIFANYHGEVVNENANTAIQRVSDKVSDWASKDPNVFHTPEGLDKLKQWIGGELENVKPGTKADAALKGIYNSVKSTIGDQAPTYAKTMADYEAASDQLREISRTLSLNPNASIDASVRKLQSIMRNNVATNYGNRAGAVDALEQQGGANLRGALAGQTMSSWTPRGMAGVADAAALVPAVIHNPMLAGAAAAGSPRLVGEAAYGMGRAAGAVSRGANRMPGLPLSSVVPLTLTQDHPVYLNELLRNQLMGGRPNQSP